jgi:hypothetical protein
MGPFFLAGKKILKVMLIVTLLFRALAVVEVHGNMVMLKKNCQYFKTSCFMGQVMFL